MHRKLLVIHQGALGDVLLAFPVLEALKRESPVWIGLACRNQAGKIAQAHGLADRWFHAESSRFAALFSRETAPASARFLGEFEVIVLFSLSRNPAHPIRSCCDATVFQIPPRPPATDRTHVAVHIWETLGAAGLLQTGHALSRSWTFPNSYPAGETLSERIIIHPGAGSRRKRWSLDRFVSLARAIRNLGMGEVRFLLGPDEWDLAPLIRKQAKAKFDIAQVENLDAAAALLRSSRCFVGNDSGLTHLSSMMGLPTIALFGPSSPQRWRPLGPHVTLLRGETACAGPCFEIDKTNCEYPECLSRVTVESVLTAVSAVMGARDCGQRDLRPLRREPDTAPVA